MNIGLFDVDSHNFPNLALMKISAYHKQNGGSFEMRSDDFNRNYNLPYDGKFETCNGVYDSYKLALQVAEQYTARELKRLQEYNEKFGTTHVAAFKIEHDPKSN